MNIYHTHKICTKCKSSKALEDFSIHKATKDGRQTICNVCRSVYQKSPKGKKSVWKRDLKRKYNITVEQYNEMFDSQNGICPGCLKHQSKFKRRLCVDHCHLTGKIRGLLCGECNMVLGKVRDSTETLLRLVKYLS